jgi:hypothetical protein
LVCGISPRSASSFASGSANDRIARCIPGSKPERALRVGSSHWREKDRARKLGDGGPKGKDPDGAAPGTSVIKSHGLVVPWPHESVVDRAWLIERVSSVSVGGVAALRLPVGIKGQLMRKHGNFMARRAFRFDAGLGCGLSLRWSRHKQRRRQGGDADQQNASSCFRPSTRLAAFIDSRDARKPEFLQAREGGVGRAAGGSSPGAVGEQFLPDAPGSFLNENQRLDHQVQNRGASGLRRHDASVAFSLRPHSGAYRLFIGPTWKGSSGST